VVVAFDRFLETSWYPIRRFFSPMKKNQQMPAGAGLFKGRATLRAAARGCRRLNL
jgi:hypothetical protein